MASKSAGAKGDVPKIYGFVHPLHPCYRIPCTSHQISNAFLFFTLRALGILRYLLTKYQIGCMCSVLFRYYRLAAPIIDFSIHDQRITLFLISHKNTHEQCIPNNELESRTQIRTIIERFDFDCR